MNLRIINLIGEILDEVTSWFNLSHIFIFLVIVGVAAAIFVPMVVQ